MIQVTSEIAHLRRVLVHEPGLEIDTMVPSTMGPLLFDDLLFGQSAREEHRRFCQVMSYLGIEVLEAFDLLVEALDQPGAREWIGRRVHVDQPGWLEAEASTVAGYLLYGVRRKGGGMLGTLEDMFTLPPLPNWCFQRDPQVVLGDSVVFSHMATEGRRREPLLSQTVFRFHPLFKDTPVIFDGHMPDGAPPLHLEGGDVLVLNPEVVAIGISIRTEREAVLALAEALAERENGPRWLVAVEVPRKRSYMHLDTVFTPADRDLCMVFPPVVLDDGPEAARVFTLDVHAKQQELKPALPLMETLKERGLDLKPVPCGGDDLINQQREQWTDGSNALTVAPGVLFIYRRNHHTADRLEREGFRVVEAEDILMGRQSVNLDAGDRTCILLSCHELSRARGGPHCLTHPLERDPL